MKILLATILVSLLMIGCSRDGEILKSDTETFEPKLVSPIRFSNFVLSELGPERDLDSLFDVPISIGEGRGQSYEFMRLRSDDPDSYIRTETAREYLDARARGAMPMTTYDISMNSWFTESVPVLVFLRDSIASEESLMFDGLMDLSVDVIPWTGSEERIQIEGDTASGLTLRDYAEKNLIKIIPRESPHEIGFQKGSQEVVVKELARGDHDHDGYEDCLISTATYYIGGSGRSYSNHLVTRTPEMPVMKIDHFVVPFTRATDDR